MGNSKYRGNHNHNISHYNKIKKMKVYCVPYSGKNIATKLIWVNDDLKYNDFIKYYWSK